MCKNYGRGPQTGGDSSLISSIWFIRTSNLWVSCHHTSLSNLICSEFQRPNWVQTSSQKANRPTVSPAFRTMHIFLSLLFRLEPFAVSLTFDTSIEPIPVPFPSERLKFPVVIKPMRSSSKGKGRCSWWLEDSALDKRDAARRCRDALTSSAFTFCWTFGTAWPGVSGCGLFDINDIHFCRSSALFEGSR